MRGFRGTKEGHSEFGFYLVGGVMVTGVFLLHLEGESKSQGDLDTNSSFVYYPLPNCNGGFFAMFAVGKKGVSSIALSLRFNKIDFYPKTRANLSFKIIL